MSEKQVKRRFPFEEDESVDDPSSMDVDRDSPEVGPPRVSSAKSTEAKKGKRCLKDHRKILSDNILQRMLDESDIEEIEEPESTGQSSSVVEDSISDIAVADPSSLVATMMKDSDLEEEFDEVEMSSDWEEEEEEENATYMVVPPTTSSHGPTSPVHSTPAHFSGNSGTKQVQVIETPIDYFFHLFTDQFFELIIKETNDQANILISKSKKPKARIRGWKPLTREDLEVFLGLIFLTGHIKTPSLNHYWKANKLYNFPIFRNAMARDRFFMILRALHFSKNLQGSDLKSSDPLHKVSSLFDIFHRRMEEIYYPVKESSLGESMLLWHGHLYVRRYIKNKRHKFDIKFYMLMQPNGVVVKTRIYCGTSDSMLEETSKVEKVVKYLLDDYFGVGHSVYIDNVYSPVPLSVDLSDKNTQTTGSRKGNPKNVLKEKLKKEQLTPECKKDGVCVLKWYNRTDVLVSIELDPSTIDCTSKSGKTSENPETVLQNNRIKSEIDQSDQLLCYYPCERKTLRWYLKVAFHLFQIMMNNAFLLYKQQPDKQKTPILDFRESVIIELIYRNRPVSLPTVVTRKEQTHLPKCVPRNEKNRQVRKRCVVCNKNKKRVESVFFCDQCPEKPGLCLESCFRRHHNY